MADIQGSAKYANVLPAQKRNVLGALQLVKLYNWLSSNCATLPPGISLQQAMTVIEDALGFKVTEGNVKDALRQLELKLPSLDRAPEEILRARQAILKRAVEHLYKTFDLQLPLEWADM